MIIQSRQEAVTAEQLWKLSSDGRRYELVRGVLKMMSPAGSEHGSIAARILLRLASHVESKGLGKSYAAETGFRIATNPDTVRAADASFVSYERLATVEPTRGYLPLAPDLVVEVVSPNDSYSNVEAKAKDWLEAGTRIVLIADPANLVLKANANEFGIRTFHKHETFDAGDVCGGWQLGVDDTFEIAD